MAESRTGKSGKFFACVFLAMLLAASVADIALIARGWNGFTNYESPYLDFSRNGDAPPAVAKRTVVIVVDGLRLDTSRKMPFLNKLRKRGADVVVRTVLPSLSRPAMTAILSGAPPEISGVTTNWYDDPVRVDTIFSKAIRAGMDTAAVIVPPDFGDLYGPYLTGFRGFEYDESKDMSGLVVKAALKLVRSINPRLLLVHIPEVDEAAHAYGARGERYEKEALDADRNIARLVKALDDGETLIVVTTDHGHVARGGHGGAEPEVVKVPLVLYGKGIQKGAKSDISQVDIAPTLAALMGLARPAHGTGMVQTQLISAELDRERVESMAALDIRARNAFFAHMAEVLGAEDVKLESAPEDLEAVKRSKALKGFWLRLPWVLAILSIPLFAAWTGRNKGLAAGLPAAAAFFVLYYGLFFFRGSSFSFSMFNTESQVLSYFVTRLIDGAVLAAVVGLATVSLSARWLDTRWSEALTGTGFWIEYLLWVQISVYLLVWGPSVSWRLPSLGLGLKYLSDLALSLAVAAGILAVTTAIVLSRKARIE